MIELLVVVLIIGILAAVSLPQYNKAVEKARVTEAITILNTLQKAVDVYLLENGFPQDGYDVSFFEPGSDMSDEYVIPDLEITNSMKCYKVSQGFCVKGDFAYNASCVGGVACTIGASEIRSCGGVDDSTLAGDYCRYRLDLTRTPSGKWIKSCTDCPTYINWQ